MSARVVLYCDYDMRYGTCPKQLLLTAGPLDTVAAAEQAAERYGWVARAGGHRCPEHR